ncbi:MAG: hypothetical protein ACQEXJ_23235 [Myxococcota bacterium]
MRSPWMLAALLASLAVAAGPARAAERPRIEVAFALDATGSMSPWIEAARERIAAIAEDLASGDPPPEVRFALVAYRDRGDAFVVRVDEFTPKLSEMKSRLERTDAAGGGDTPESVLEALDAGVHRLDWSVGDPDVVKLLYLVGDAPPNRYPDGPEEDVLLAEALGKGIVIHSIACGSMGRGGQAFFERVARLSEGRPFRLSDGPVRRPGGTATTTAAGATGASSLEAAVSGSARAYSGSVGVRYRPKERPTVETRPLDAPRVTRSGLLGPHLRFVPDARAWSDLWAAHGSALADGPPAPPEVDFSEHQVLALGGADEGLDLVRLEVDDGVRFAVVRPSARAGVSFVRIPRGAPVVQAPDRDGGAR